MSDVLPPGTKFRLGSEVTPEQRAFLERHGYLHFEQVASAAELAEMVAGIDGVESKFLAEGRTSVRGIPLFFGARADGTRGIQRLAFTSLFAPAVSTFVRDARFEPIRRLVGTDARIGEDEKDGVVVNRFVNVPGSSVPRLGWHTDGLRDLFYLRMPGPMLNVGLHFDDCTAENGGLRLLPGTHNQGFFAMCFTKMYFVSHKADPREICVETRAGDLTIHDGRLWHRVAQSQRTGPASLRRSMYVPYITGPRMPKDEASRTPLYHHAGAFLRRIKAALSGKAKPAAVACLALASALLPTRKANAGGFWNFDKGVENYARGGADIVAPSDPVALYLNPSSLAPQRGFQLVIDVNAISDHRRFERAGDSLGGDLPRATQFGDGPVFGPRPRTYVGVQNKWKTQPSPALFVAWNLAPLGAERVTIAAGLYGPPRNDADYSAGGPQRYTLIESHNLEVHKALSIGVAIPEARLRVGFTGMLIDQTLDIRQNFNTFLGGAEAPGYDANAHILASDKNIPSAILGVSGDLTDRLSAGVSGQLGWTVHAKGSMDATLGEDLAAKSVTISGNRVNANFQLPPLLRAGLRMKDSAGMWDAELAVVWEGWSANREVEFAPQNIKLVLGTSGLAARVPTIHLPTHLRDTFSVRTGGSWRPAPNAPLLRGGVFYERSALAHDDTSMGSFDLDKIGVSSGARVDLASRVHLDLALGAQYWMPIRVSGSRVNIPDPVHGLTQWPIGNGRYSNWRMVGMLGLGITL